MTYYNITNITSSANPVDIVIGVNQLSGQWFGILTLLSIFIISSIAMYYYGAKRSLPASLFLTTIVAVLFVGIGLVGEHILVICIILLGLSVAWLFIDNEK